MSYWIQLRYSSRGFDYLRRETPMGPFASLELAQKEITRLKTFGEYAEANFAVIHSRIEAALEAPMRSLYTAKLASQHAGGVHL